MFKEILDQCHGRIRRLAKKEFDYYFDGFGDLMPVHVSSLCMQNRK